MKISRLLILLLLSVPALAITPPTPVETKVAEVTYTWTYPTTRGTPPVLPLALNEIKESRVYITSLSAYIVVPAPANTYTYVVPSGQCIRTTDGAQVTTVDTEGRESPGSTSIARVEADRCTGKPLPGAPGAVKVTTAP